MAGPRYPNPDLSDRPIIALENDYSAGGAATLHRHARGQLIIVMVGALRLETSAGVWIVPPGRAAWVPGEVVHRADYTIRTSVLVTYVDMAAFGGLPAACSVFALSGLLRELVRRAVDLGWRWARTDINERIMRCLGDELAAAVPVGMFLPFGRDVRLRKVVDALMERPGDDRDVARWAEYAGTSARTLGRLFTAETGLSFGRWREQLRLASAIQRLANGESIARVAFELNYSSASSFTTMFTRAMGESPRGFLKALAAKGSDGRG